MKFKNIISYAGILIFLILFTSQHGIGVAQADPPMQKITNKPPIEHPTDIPDHETTKPGDAEMEIIKLNFLFNQLNGLLNQKDSLLKDIHKERKKINDNNLRLLSNHISALIEWGKRRDEAPEDIPAASMEPSSRKKTAKENIVSKVYKKDKFTADKTYLDTSNISGASTGISLQPDSEYADLKPTSDEWEGLKFHNTSRTLKDLLDQKTKLENEIHNLFFKKISPKIPSSDVETQIKHMTY